MIVYEKFNGEAEQDKFVFNILNEKENGFFVELGSNHPINDNNTYFLEEKYNWKGLMVEHSNQWLELYKAHRPDSIHIIGDGTKIDYMKVFDDNNFPLNIDYLQIDLEANNGSSLHALEKFDEEAFDKYKFATVTFEHDICRTDAHEMRKLSRDIFESRGYYRVLDDIHNREPKWVFEDWYVHPNLVDMEYARNLRKNNLKNYVENSITETSIDWRKIQY